MSIITSSTKAAADAVTAVNNNAQRLDDLIMAGDYATSGGAANVQTLALDAQIVAYVTGMTVKFKAGFANTGSATLNVNAIGAKTIKRQGGVDDLKEGDILSGQICICVYDGTNMQLVSAPGRVIDNIFVVTAGETIAVNEVVAYDTTENEFMLADANNTARVRARGLALTAGTNGAIMLIQTGGIYTAPSGTPFSAEAQHYLSDTPGALSSTPSTTTSVPIGYAISTTVILLTFGKKIARGTGTSQTADGITDETITLGFRPELLILSASVRGNGTESKAGTISFVNGVAAGGHLTVAQGGVFTNEASPSNWSVTEGAATTTFSLLSVSDTNFVIRTNCSNASAVGSEEIGWVAMGE